MSSLIANKIKINLYLVSIKQIVARAITIVFHYSQLEDTTVICFARYSTLLTTFLKTTTLVCKWQRSLNHDCFLHMQLVFTQDWLNSYYSLSALSCVFICPHKQSDEGSWSRMHSREFYSDFIVVCVFCSHCLLLRSLTLRFVFYPRLFHNLGLCFCNSCLLF